MAESTISGLTLKSVPAATTDLIEISYNPGSGPISRSLTLGAVIALATQQLSAQGLSRWIPGYGIQYFDSDPAIASHPWRTSMLLNGAPSLSGGVPDIAPAIPVLASAAHSGSANNLTFSWTDGNYTGTGNLEVWKNGTALVTNLAPGATTYTDNGGIVSDSYTVRWNNATFASAYSNAVVAS